MMPSLRKIVHILIVLIVLNVFVYLSTYPGAANNEIERLSWKITWDFNVANNPNGRLEASIPLPSSQTCFVRADINTYTIVGNVPIQRGQAWFDGSSYIQYQLPTAETIRQLVAEQCQVQITDVCFIENDTFWTFVKAEPDFPSEAGQTINPVLTQGHLEIALLTDQLQTILRYPDQTQVVISHSTTNLPPPPTPSLPDILASQSPPYTFFTYGCQTGNCSVQQWKDHSFLGDGNLLRGIEFFTHINNTFYIGYSPTTETYFSGSIDKLVVDPGNFIDHGIMDFLPLGGNEPANGEQSHNPPGFPRADFNGDGHTDLLWRNVVSNTLSVWFMDGATQLEQVEIVSSVWPDPSWKVVGIHHFNNENDTTTLSDDSVDILWRNDTSGQLAIWLMEGITHTNGVLLEGLPDLNWRVVGTGDFNDDTKTDLLWRHEASGELKVWFFDGTTPGELVDLLPRVPDGLNWRILGIGNFNRDAQVDILWQHRASGAFTLWLMDGVGLLEEHPLLPGQLTDLNWQVAALWDVDSNGTTDIIWRHQVSGRLVLWAMDGANRLCGRFLTPDRWEDLNWEAAGPR